MKSLRFYEFRAGKFNAQVIVQLILHDTKQFCTLTSPWWTTMVKSMCKNTGCKCAKLLDPRDNWTAPRVMHVTYIYWYLYRVLQGRSWSLWAGQRLQQQVPLQGQQKCPGQLSYDVWPLHPELKAVLTSGVWSKQPNFGELIDTWIKHRHLKSIILKFTFYYW